MTRYNAQHDAGVTGYNFTVKGILLQFKDGNIYYYSYKKPGKHHVEEMKRLAISGKGLTTYVNQFVRENYEAKMKQ